MSDIRNDVYERQGPHVVRKLIDLFRLPTENEEVVKSQVAALLNQIPLVYFLLCSGAIIVSYANFNLAPQFLTVWVPVALIVVCLVRLRRWVKNRQLEWTYAQCVAQLRQTRKLTVLLIVLFFAWIIALYQFGDTSSRTQLALYVAVTINGVSICLLQVRSAALSGLALTLLLFVVQFGGSGRTDMIAIAINEFIAAIVLGRAVTIHYGAFVDLVNSRSQLMQQNVEIQKLSDANFKIANHDSLTGLPNRRFFFDTLRKMIAEREISGRPFALALVDLDGFKPVNDVYGHNVGDELLMAAAGRLTGILGGGSFVARLGGDEFAIILADAPEEHAAQTPIQAINDILSSPFYVAGAVAKVTASIGLAVYPVAGTTDDTLYDRADYALYHAKANRRGGSVMFSTEHEHAIRTEAQVEQQLRGADIAGEFSLAYQPIVSAATGLTVAFEALARWDSPTMGRLGPGLFIPAAEKLDVIGTMTVDLFGKALAEMVHWPDHIRLSFNLSARDIVSASTVLRLINLVQQGTVDPRRIDFEVTETLLLGDFDMAERSIRALRQLGAGIALDDFGTGFSSLSYVHRLSPTKIKIDQSFTRELDKDAGSRNIIQTIVNMCRNLELDCVLEGIETEAQRQTARDLGCSLMQGYYFARPMDVVQIADYLQDEESRRLANAPVEVAWAS